MLRGVVHGHGAAAGENDHDRLAGGDHRFDQVLLRLGEFNGCAVVPLAFLRPVQADADDGHVGIFGDLLGLGDQDGGRRNPVELRGAFGAGLLELHSHGIPVAALQLQRRRTGAPAALALPLPRPESGGPEAGGSAGVDFLVVEEQSDLPVAIPLSGARRNDIIAGGRRRERAGPANRILVAVDGRHHGRLFHEGIEVHARLAPAELWLALEFGVIPILGQQSRRAVGRG